MIQILLSDAVTSVIQVTPCYS